MIKKILILLLLSVIFMLGCSTSFFDKIATNNKVPDPAVKPVVKSFAVQDSIVIDWNNNSDVGADGYVLYRAMWTTGIDPSNLAYSQIYSGTNLTYTDYVGNYNEGTFFYYKIAKKRESKEFDKSDYAAGVVSRHTALQNNNSLDTALDIDNFNTLNLNIYYACDGFGNEIVVSDYFKMLIPAGVYFEYQIQFPTNSNIPTDGLAIYNYEEVTNVPTGTGSGSGGNVNFNVYNRTTSGVYCMFSVSVNKSQYFGNPSPTSGVEEFVMGYYTLAFVGSFPVSVQ